MAADGTVGAQEFPASGAHTVDLEADRIGPGHYVAAWPVPADQEVGYYKVVWSITVGDGDDPIELETRFEVVTKLASSGPLYASVASMRAEGVASSVADYQLHAKLVGASRQFEMYTKRFFEPRYKSLRLDGRGGTELLLREPIIGIEE
ncbi:MAG TPA: hypothetical protein VFQ76_21505, partial [Longimicrobiaceae bacterium]|nr:hypothetical protein [Longimicrobiaceae bacterium]